MFDLEVYYFSAVLMDLHLHFWYCLFTFSESGAKRLNLLSERLDAELEATCLLADDNKLQLGFIKQWGFEKSKREQIKIYLWIFLPYFLHISSHRFNDLSETRNLCFGGCESKRMDAVPLSDWVLISNISDLYLSDCSRMVRLSSREASSCWRRSSYCFCKAL